MNNKLINYLPHNAIKYINLWISNYPLEIQIRNKRTSKLGDYRYIPVKNQHIITINNNLSKEAFFFVLTHEIAHLLVQIQYKNSVKPHGIEWKNCFGKLLKESISVYPKNIQSTIFNHAQKPKASVGADKNIALQLLENLKQGILVENLNENQKFRLGKKIFKRGIKRKIRYLCKEVKSGKMYSVNGLAVIDEIID